MKTPTARAFTILAALVCNVSVAQLALTPVGPLSYSSSQYSQTVGWEFIVNSPVTVTELGVLDSTQSGLVDPHNVGLWTLNGSLITSTTVQSGTLAAFEAGFRFSSIAQVMLDPGTYFIGAQYIAGSKDQFSWPAPTATTIPEVTLVQATYAHGSVLTCPSNGAGQNEALLGPDFRIATVPEPGSLSLLNFGLCGAVAICRANGRNKRTPHSNRSAGRANGNRS